MPDRLTIEYLLRKHLRNELTESERGQLRAELLNDGQSDNFKTVIYQLHTEEFNTSLYNPEITDEIVNSILKEYPARQTPIVPIQKRNTTWLRYAAAILIILGVGAYLWNITQADKPLITTIKPVPVKNDILPGSEKATLTLSNGEKVELNNSAGETIKDGTLSIKNNSGQLIYGDYARHSGAPKANPESLSSKVSYNTMTTPKGGQYKLTLSDGTKVWLNAASSITYPTTFTSNTREVSITGEAYFEVTKNKTKPFIVKTSKEDITVLGTSFNAYTYADDPQNKISLIEGSVKVNQHLLKPGQAYQNGKIIPTNITEDIAWKNGFFSFNDADIKTVMRQLARWYDVEVKFEGQTNKRLFNGRIERGSTIQQVLEILSDIDIHYRIENKTIIILP